MLKNLLLASSAVVFLVLMAQKNELHRYTSEHANHHADAQQGLITVPIDSIIALEIKQNGESWRIDNVAGKWMHGPSMLNHAEQHKIVEYLAMLRNSKPVRTFRAEELESKNASVYGLNTPSLETSVLFHHASSAKVRESDFKNETGGRVAIRFGHASPDGSLRYVHRHGGDELYVMSGFIFAQAEDVIETLEKTQK